MTFFVTSCSIADLRTPLVLKQGLTDAGIQRGRALLAHAVAAHGGVAQWSRHGTAELLMRDEWRGFYGWLFRPWPGNPQRMSVRYLLGTFSSRCRFLDGPAKGRMWGLQSWSFFERSPGGRAVFGKNSDASFILPAYQYFFELPFRISKAPIVVYAGERRFSGEDFDLVLATWGRLEPHSRDDQYLLWINRRTSLIEIVQYTIRDLYDHVVGVNRFSDFREVDGMKIPFRYSISTELEEDDDFVHRVTIEHVRFDPVPKEAFLSDIWPDLFEDHK